MCGRPGQAGDCSSLVSLTNRVDKANDSSGMVRQVRHVDEEEELGYVRLGWAGLGYNVILYCFIIIV